MPKQININVLVGILFPKQHELLRYRAFGQIVFQTSKSVESLPRIGLDKK